MKVNDCMRILIIFVLIFTPFTLKATETVVEKEYSWIETTYDKEDIFIECGLLNQAGFELYYKKVANNIGDINLNTIDGTDPSPSSF